MADPLAALEASRWAAFVREGALVYPAFNVLHVLAVMVFYAVVAAMDVALLAAREPPAGAVRRLRPIALAAFALVAVTGFALFSPEATGNARNAAFQLKVLLIAVAGANALVSTWALARRPALARTTAVASLVLWLSVAAAGRMIAYV